MSPKLMTVRRDTYTDTEGDIVFPLLYKEQYAEMQKGYVMSY